MNILSPDKIKDLTDIELQNLNARLHSYWQQMESGAKDFNREELVNQYVWVLEEMRIRDMKHKVRDNLDREALTLLNKSQCPLWLAAYPDIDEIEKIVHIQNILSLDASGRYPKDELHLTMQLFSDMHNIDSIRDFIINNRIPEDGFVFTVDGLDIFGEESVIVLTGSVPDNMSEMIDKLRNKYPASVQNYPFNPHITLGYSDNFLLLSDEDYNSVIGLKIRMDIPKLMVSLEKGDEIWSSSLNIDENTVEEVLCKEVIEKKLDQSFSEALSNIDDLVVIPDVVSISGSSVDPNNNNPKDIDLIWRFNWEEGKAEIDLRNFLMKFDRAFPPNIQDKFQHIGAPQGASWSYVPLMDLVLRNKNKELNPIILDESDAYYKPIDKAKTSDEIRFVIIGRSRKTQRFDLLEEEKPEKNLMGEKAFDLYQKLTKDSNTWMLRCGILDGKDIIPIEGKSKLSDSDLFVHWNAEIAEPAWQGLDDPRLWDMMDDIPHRTKGDYGYWASFTKKFDKDPQIGEILSIKPARLLKFLGSDKVFHYTWLWPTIISITDKGKADDVKDISNLIEEEFPDIKLGAMGNVTGSGTEWIGEEWDNIVKVSNGEESTHFRLLKDGTEVELMKPFTPIKSTAGYHKNEFFVGEEDDVWRMWAEPYLKESR